MLMLTGRTSNRQRRCAEGLACKPCCATTQQTISGASGPWQKAVEPRQSKPACATTRKRTTIRSERNQARRRSPQIERPGLQAKVRGPTHLTSIRQSRHQHQPAVGSTTEGLHDTAVNEGGVVELDLMLMLTVRTSNRHRRCAEGLACKPCCATTKRSISGTSGPWQKAVEPRQSKPACATTRKQPTTRHNRSPLRHRAPPIDRPGLRPKVRGPTHRSSIRQSRHQHQPPS